MADEPKDSAPGAFWAKRRPGWTPKDPQEVHQLQFSNELDTSLAGQRRKCPKCGQSRALLCYDCLVPLVDSAPQLALPLQISIVAYAGEPASKSTRSQAAVIAPNHVQIHGIDELPPGTDPARTVVLFPSPQSVLVSELQPGTVDRAVLIDAAWKKASDLAASPALAGMRHVRLDNTRSAFWRFHTAGVADDGVCTVEALLHFLRAMARHGMVPAAVPPTLTPGSAPAPAHPPPAITLQPEAPAADPSHTAAALTSQPPQADAAVTDGASGPGGEAEGALASTAGPDDPDPDDRECHDWDDLLWFFTLQHRYIQHASNKRNEARLAKLTAAQQQGAANAPAGQPAGKAQQRGAKRARADDELPAGAEPRAGTGE